MELRFVRIVIEKDTKCPEACSLGIGGYFSEFNERFEW